PRAAAGSAQADRREDAALLRSNPEHPDRAPRRRTAPRRPSDGGHVFRARDDSLAAAMVSSGWRADRGAGSGGDCEGCAGRVDQAQPSEARSKPPALTRLYRLSAFGSRLSAFGFRRSAFGFRLSTVGANRLA